MISGSSSTTRMRLRGAVVMRPPSARPTRGSAAGLRAGGDWRAASDRDHGENRSTTGARARVGDGDAPTQGGRSMGIGGWIFLAVVVAVVVWVMAMYNGLVTLRNRFRNAFSQIDVQLRRRYDMIPNLVETAKGYMKHERETLEAVIAARNAAYSASQAAAARPGDPQAIRALASAESQLTGVMSRLMAVAESYPELKANQNMLALQEELTSTENKIAFARQGFNDAVMRYNVGREQFPAVLLAGLFGFGPGQLLEIEDKSQRVAPQVTFT